MSYIYKSNEPIKNAFKKKVLMLAVSIYGFKNSRITNLKRLFRRYNYSFSELIVMIRDLEKRFFEIHAHAHGSDNPNKLANIDNYKKHEKRIYANMRPRENKNIIGR